MNNIHNCIRLIFIFRIIFIFVFVQKKLYLLHSGFDPGRVTNILVHSSHVNHANVCPSPGKKGGMGITRGTVMDKVTWQSIKELSLTS